LDIKDLELFIAVAKLGSFSKAAKSFDTRRALVSRRIGEIEKQLGAPLFTRTTRVMTLTTAGRQYLAQIEPLVNQLNHAGYVFKHRHDEVQGKLRIGLLPFVDKLMDKYIARFIHAYPQVQLEVLIVSAGSKELNRLGLDVIIDANEVNGANLAVHKLTTFERKIYASPGYLEKSSLIENTDDLQYHSLLGFRDAHGQLEQTWHFQHANVPTHYKVICSDFNSLYHFCLAGAGIALLPHVIADEAVELGQLINILPQHSIGFADISLVYSTKSPQSSVAKAFCEHLFTEMAAN